VYRHDKRLSRKPAQVPTKSVLMDVVVIDIPPKYGMLLSWSKGAKIGGSLQLDMMYTTILVFQRTVHAIVQGN
jgi:hypothetical protein